jgi:SpoVK/Ycf46/Vps4 family AAA+-type ATPase
MDDALLGSIGRAVEGAPDDLALRLHYARLLLDAGRRDDGVAQLGAILARDPANAEALGLLSAGPAAAEPTAAEQPSTEPAAPAVPASPAASRPSSVVPPTEGEDSAGFDWDAAEEEIDGPERMFVDGGPDAQGTFDVERSHVSLADVGGLDQVKQRLQASFIAPLKNPELRKMYGATMKGGLLLYGPPGCGKTFIAKAVAGELGARFITAGLSDLVSEFRGQSEKAVHELFQLARRESPCVIFLDELDAIGQRRSMTRYSGMRSIVVQLLQEMDGVEAVNDGVFVLGATNQPWDVDPALRRPGRFDRTVLVLPPDQPARRAIFEVHLRERPVTGIDLDALASHSDGLTGADIAYVCQVAGERALLDSVDTGTPRMIGMPDLVAAMREVKPSAGPWLESARNVVEYGQDDGTFAELRAYLKKVKRL